MSKRFAKTTVIIVMMISMLFTGSAYTVSFAENRDYSITAEKNDSIELNTNKKDTAEVRKTIEKPTFILIVVVVLLVAVLLWILFFVRKCKRKHH